MNSDRAQGSWRQWKGWLRQRWASLNSDQLGELAGEREILAGKLQVAYGLGKELAGRRIDDWQSAMRDAADDNDEAPRQADARQ